MSAPPSSTPTDPPHQWLRGAQWSFTGIVLLAMLVGLARWAWLHAQVSGVPVDFVAYWGGERVGGLARQCPPMKPLRNMKFEPLPADSDGAYSFLQPGEWGELGHFGIGRAWTLAAWSRLDAATTNQPNFPYLIGGGVGYPTDWHLIRMQGKVGVIIGVAEPLARPLQHPRDRPSPAWTFTAPFPDEVGAWVHLAATYRNEDHQVRLFANGREVGRTNHPFPAEARTFNLHMGANPESPEPMPARRQVDDLIYYERALPPDQVAALAANLRGGLPRTLDLLPQLQQIQKAAPTALPWALALVCLAWGAPWLAIWWWRTVFADPSGPRTAFKPVVFALLAGLLGASGTAALAAHWINSIAERRLASEVRQLQEAADAHFEKVMTLLFAIRGQLPATGPVTPQAWQQIMSEPKLREDFGQTWPLGYAEYVPPGGRAKHTAEWSDLQKIRYRIHSSVWTDEPDPRLADQPALPVTLLSPTFPLRMQRAPPAEFLLGRDLFATGLNERTNALLARMAREGLKERRSAPPAEMSAFGYPGGSLVGLMLFLPAPDRSPNHDGSHGLLFAGNSLPLFLQSTFGASQAPDFGTRWSWEIDGEAPIQALDSVDLWPETREPSHPWRRHAATILLYGARLRCDFWTTPLFDRQNHRHAPWFIFLAGLLLTLFGTSFMAGQIRARLIETANSHALQVVNHQLAAATRERARLSRDLHDGTIQNLYAIGLEVTQARALTATDPERAAADLGRVLTTLQAAIAELRQFVLELEPDAWPGQSVRLALESLLNRLRRTAPITFHLAVSPASDALPPRTAIHALQLVREALSNALRHAQARQVWVVLEPDFSAAAPGWKLEIRDDGQGFSVSAGSESGGRGLRSFRERALELGGHCEIDSQPGSGTRVTVRFPTPSS